MVFRLVKFVEVKIEIDGEFGFLKLLGLRENVGLALRGGAILFDGFGFSVLGKFFRGVGIGAGFVGEFGVI